MGVEYGTGISRRVGRIMNEEFCREYKSLTEGKTMSKLPARLEAWDAEEKVDGWAIDAKEMKVWLESLLSETRKGMVLKIGTMIKYLT